MKKIIKLFLLLGFIFSFAQTHTLSDGALEVEGNQISVKIFSSPRMIDIDEVLVKNEDVLIILSKWNTEARTQEEVDYLSFVYDDFKSKGYKVFDKNFQEVENPLGKAQYLLKLKDIQKIEGKNIELNTTFKIWNPKEGIEIFGFNLRYYGLMFVIAFGLGLFIMRQIFRIDGEDEKYLDPLFTLTLLGTIFGARIGHVLFYEPYLFVDDFWSVFLPIRTKPHLEFTGFSGLASHGAAIALILTTLYYSFRIIKKNPLWVFDRLGIVVALAGFFIRMGNFFNSEIIGKPIDPTSFFAIYFPQQGLDYGAIVPRYPAQLIEAVAYLCLFLLLWALYRLTNKKHQQGWLIGIFFAVLWSIRFFAEFLKEPQGEEYISFLGLNTGQILSLPFILLGGVVMLYSTKFKKA